MSTWYEAKKKDIEINEDKDEIYAYLYSDDFGAVYATFKIKDVKEIFKKEIDGAKNLLKELLED